MLSNALGAFGEESSQKTYGLPNFSTAEEALEKIDDLISVEGDGSPYVRGDKVSLVFFKIKPLNASLEFVDNPAFVVRNRIS